MFKGKFKDIVQTKDGFLRGPFGSALKKSLFVSKNKNTYKVYEQSVVLEKNKNLGRYYISNKYFEKELKRFAVKSGDFLVSCSGVNYGAIYQLKGEIENGVINQALLRIRLNHNLIDDNYFLYYFKTYIVKAITKGTGDSTIPNFPSMDFIKNIDIEIPTLNIQKQIGYTLKNIDDKIELNNKINAELEAMAKTIYDYWFLQFEFPNEEGKPYKSSGGKMVWNEELKRELPEGWNLCTIKDISICHDSKRIPLSNKERERIKGNIPYYGATGIMGYVNQYIFEGNYVLVAEDGSIMNENGNPVLQRIYGKTWVNNHAHVLEPTNNYSCKLLMMILKDIPVVAIKTGSIQSKINQDNLNRVKILSIPEKLKKQINTILNNIDKKILLNKRENRELISLRDFLLPLLMNGQIRFTEDKA